MNAVITHLTIRRWGGSRIDRTATRDVLRRNGAASDGGRFRKSLYAACGKARFSAILAAENAARVMHRRYTLPWLDDAGRVCPVRMLFEYQKELRGSRGRWQTAVQEAVNNWDPGRARPVLGSLWQAGDFPSKAQFERAFQWEHRVLPLPDADGDWRIAVPEEQQEELRREAREALASQWQDSTRELWGRVLKVVEKVAQKLGDPEAIFRDSLIRNVQKEIQIVSKLNLTGDEDLARILRGVAEGLGGTSPDVLRKAPGVRGSVAQEAERLAQRIRGYL